MVQYSVLYVPRTVYIVPRTVYIIRCTMYDTVRRTVYVIHHVYCGIVCSIKAISIPWDRDIFGSRWYNYIIVCVYFITVDCNGYLYNNSGYILIQGWRQHSWKYVLFWRAQTWRIVVHMYVCMRVRVCVCMYVRACTMHAVHICASTRLAWGAYVYVHSLAIRVFV